MAVGTALTNEQGTAPAQRLEIIDCDVHPVLPEGMASLLPYMPAGWRERLQNRQLGQGVPSPGELRMETFVRKRGRTVSVVDVELICGDRTGVHAVVTLGEPEHRAAPLLSANPVVALMDPEPPLDVESIGPGHPMHGTVNYWTGCDIRPLM